MSESDTPRTFGLSDVVGQVEGVEEAEDVGDVIDEDEGLARLDAELSHGGDDVQAGRVHDLHVMTLSVWWGETIQDSRWFID